MGAADQHGPPPPYESVVMSDADVSRGAHAGSARAPPAFEITVSEPIKQGDGVGAFQVYRVRTQTSLPQYRERSMEVTRRFSHFHWLHQRLAEHNRGIIIPPVPDKDVVQKFQMSKGFLSQRRAALERFINRVAAHPALAESPDLRAFLEDNEGEWAVEVARAAAESGTGAKKTLAGVVHMFKDLGQNTIGLIAGGGGKHEEADEDPEYLKVREYMGKLETHLAEAHRQAMRLIKRQDALASALADFGTSMMALGKFESGDLAQSFMRMGDKAEVLAHSAHEQTNSLGASFEAPLKEFVRLVKSAKATMTDRAAALADLHSARNDVHSKRSKLMKLRGTPGIREDKIGEVERELNTAQQNVEAAQATFETIASRMSTEVARFQAERAEEIAAVLCEFAQAQAHAATQNAATWRSLLPPDAVQADGH